MSEPTTAIGRDIVRGMHPAYPYRLIDADVVRAIESEAAAAGARQERERLLRKARQGHILHEDRYMGDWQGCDHFACHTTRALLAEPEDA